MTFYIGTEVNHTPAFSKRTLFVEDFQTNESIEKMAREYKTPHISLAANNTFVLENNWNNQLVHLLDRGFMVTLEYPAELHDILILDLSKGVLQSRNFVPLPRVHIDGLATINPNLTIKINDVNGDGFWTMHFHQIMDSNRYVSNLEIDMQKIDRDVEPVPVKISNLEHLVNNGTNLGEDVKLPDVDLGLDPDGQAVLKPEPEFESKVAITVSTNEEAADLYTGDVKTDPLSTVVAKKGGKKK